MTDGATTTARPVDGSGAPRPNRDPDLVVARAHLRLGALGLARAELETMAGRDRLDDEAIRDLAEARWRTGDTLGAGEAAAAYLEVQAEDILALVIAAEAQAELGRPGEARRLAGKAMDRASGSLDPVFAGMRRSSIWPAEDAAADGPAGVLFDDLHPGPVVRSSGHVRRDSDRREPTETDGTHAPFDPALPAEFHHGPSLWDDESLAAADAGPSDPMELFHQARVALDEGRPDAAAPGLLLALRASPALAPAVLDLLAGRSEPILVLVRGDALAIVGRTAEAARDHAAAAQDVTDATDVPIDAGEPAADAPPDDPAPSAATVEEPPDEPAPRDDSTALTDARPPARPAAEGGDREEM